MLQKQAMQLINTIGREQIELLNKRYQNIKDAQDELTKAVITIYKLQVKIAEKLEIEIPEPLLKMEVEE